MFNRFVSIVGALFWLASFAFGNLVFNGNFAGGTYNQSYGSCPASPPSCVTDVLPDGWSNNPTDPDTLSNLNVVSVISGFSDPLGDSSQYMAFASLASGGNQDCFFQSIATVPGQLYTVTFWLAVDAAGSNIYMSFEWDVGGSNDQTVFPTGFSGGMYATQTTTSGPIAFEEFTYNLIASNTQTGFYFHGDGDGSTAQVLLADVSVTEDSGVPEPGPHWFIGSGLGAFAALRYAKKKIARTVVER